MSHFGDPRSGRKTGHNPGVTRKCMGPGPIGLTLEAKVDQGRRAVCLPGPPTATGSSGRGHRADPGGPLKRAWVPISGPVEQRTISGGYYAIPGFHLIGRQAEPVAEGPKMRAPRVPSPNTRSEGERPPDRRSLTEYFSLREGWLWGLAAPGGPGPVGPKLQGRGTPEKHGGPGPHPPRVDPGESRGPRGLTLEGYRPKETPRRP